jgi:2-C-methyl-D-erythritol 4-phosphate cytidylyltransferase
MEDGAMPVLPMKDTVYLSEDGLSVSALLERKQVFAGQAPESFRFGKYIAANEVLLPEKILKINGSAEPAILAGMQIKMISGDENNYKITTETDLRKFIDEKTSR